MNVQIEISVPDGGFTFDELRAELKSLTQVSPPRSTLYHWLSKVCLIPPKPLYSANDLEWLVEWLNFRATRSNRIEAFHQFMQSKLGESPNG